MRLLSIIFVLAISLNANAKGENLFDGLRNRSSLECSVNKVVEGEKEYIEATIEPTMDEFKEIDFLNLGSMRIGPFEPGTIDKLLKEEKFEVEHSDESAFYGLTLKSGPIFSRSKSIIIWSHFKDEVINDSIAKYNEVSFEVKKGKLLKMGMRQNSKGAGKLGLTKKVHFFCTAK
jgi:hypothetical protein